MQYEVIMGSVAYGVSNDSSDMDIYAFAIPPKGMMFPHLRGEIPGFDQCAVQFEQYQQHHILDAAALGGKGRVYDVTVFAIAKYFSLLTDCLEQHFGSISELVSRPHAAERALAEIQQVLQRYRGKP